LKQSEVDILKAPPRLVTVGRELIIWMAYL